MRRILLGLALVLCLCVSAMAAPVEIELVQYKPEAFRTFDALAEKFNKTHPNIHLTISSPNEPITILKTRFIRENYPDISDYKGLANIKKAYPSIMEGLKFVPVPGVFGVPYNKNIFDAHGWKIPESWPEFVKLGSLLRQRMRAYSVAPTIRMLAFRT